jgi:hypothetical protein
MASVSAAEVQLDIAGCVQWEEAKEVVVDRF